MIKISLPQSKKPVSVLGFPNANKPKPTKVRINGFGIPVRNAFSWGYQSGVSPQTVRFSLADGYASRLVSVINRAEGRVSLTIEGESIDRDAISETFNGLSLQPLDPDTHNHDAFTITDDRWRWPLKKVYGTFNLIRKVNDIIAFTSLTTAVRPTLIEARRAFVPWTLKPDASGEPRTPWKALDIVVHVLTEFLGYSKEDIYLDRASKSNYVPPNIVLVGQSAHSVISRFLSDSDNNLYIDKEGKVHIYAERVPFGLTEFEEQLLPSMRGKVAGNLWIQDRQAIRPEELYVSFELEEEYLLTYLEEGRTVSGDTGPARTVEQATKQLESKRIYLENVTETVVDNQVGGLPRGSLVTIEEALRAFGQTYGNAAITLEQFRANYGVASPSVFNLVLQNPSNEALFDPKALVQWNNIVRDYRMRFRIPEPVMQFIKDANNVLVEIINPQTGKRRPSEVFSKISWVVHTVARVTGNRTQGITLDSFSNLANSAKFEPVPVLASGIDTDLGVFTIQGLEDLHQPGAVSSIIMGRPVNGDRFFEDSFAEGESVLAADSLIGAHGLEGNWELSITVSLVLLPRNSKSMKWIKVNPPSGVTAGNGPPLEVHTGLDTARLCLTSLLQSYRSSNIEGWVNRSICEAIAEQEGLKRWVTYADQITGNVTFSLSKESLALRPMGPVSNVKFSVSSNGAIRMGFSARPISEGRDVKNTLEREVLEAVFKQVHFNVSKGTR
jgi:hypothetical protein